MSPFICSSPAIEFGLIDLVWCKERIITWETVQERAVYCHALGGIDFPEDRLGEIVPPRDEPCFLLDPGTQRTVYKHPAVRCFAWSDLRKEWCEELYCCAVGFNRFFKMVCLRAMPNFIP